MAKDLKFYVLLVCLPAVALTGIGLVFLERRAAAESAREDERRRDRVEFLAASLQETVNESTPAALPETLSAWRGGDGVRTPSAAFAWSPKNRLEWSAPQGALGPDIATNLNSLAHWNDWTALGKKRARRGLMPAGGGYVLWGRVGNTLYGLHFASHPLGAPPSAALETWMIGGTLVALLSGILVSGALLLGRAAAKAREDDARKTTFVSNVSHELKTPLAGIGLWTDLLKNGRLKTREQRERAFAVIADENARMLRLVENLLDFSRLEQGRRRYRIECVDLHELAAAAVEAARASFPRGISAVPPPVPCLALADADALRQILSNLIGNAAKYAAEGGPVEVAARPGPPGVSLLAVSDRGPGMPPEVRRRAFDRFYRAETALESKTGGLGLGLSIARALARDLNGDLSVAARPGGGCVFTLSLMEAETATARQASAQP